MKCGDYGWEGVEERPAREIELKKSDYQNKANGRGGFNLN